MRTLLGILILLGCRPSQPGVSGGSKDRVAISQSLPAMTGDSLNVTLVEVSYGPGGSSLPHSHPCPVIGYVVSGALSTQVAGEPQVTYHAGETFYEHPNSIHLVSGNASREDSVTFLAYFVCDHTAPLSAQVPDR